MIQPVASGVGRLCRTSAGTWDNVPPGGAETENPPPRAFSSGGHIRVLGVPSAPPEITVPVTVCGWTALPGAAVALPAVPAVTAMRAAAPIAAVRMLKATGEFL